jgi:phosphoglycerate dehydrogenase-like enzyme
MNGPALRVALLDDYQDLAAANDLAGQLPDGADLLVLRRKLTIPDLVDTLHDRNVIVVIRERTEVTAELLSRLPQLKLLVTTGPYNTVIDLVAAERLGITVCATRLSMTSTIEFTWALLFAATRQIVAEEVDMRVGGWQLVRPLGPELSGRTLGLVGLGHIGTEVARIAKAFNMRVFAWSKNLTPDVAFERGAEAVAFDQLLETSDFISIHTRLSDRTFHLFGRAEFAAMKSNAYLINTSRGPIVDEDALCDALDSGQIAGAGLDVFATEPLPVDHRLRKTRGVVLSPHLAAMTTGHTAAWFMDVAEDIKSWASGKPIRVLYAA